MVLDFTWQNPYPNAYPSYDGFLAQFKASVGPNIFAPVLKYEWLLPTTTITNPNVQAPFNLATHYDLKPNLHSEVQPVPDVLVGSCASGSTCFDNIAPTASEIGKNLCTETWKFSDTAVACVQLKGSLSRQFHTIDPSLDTTNPSYASNAIQDIDLDYVSYITSSYFGDLEDGTNLIYKFDKQTVNYDIFNQETLGAIAGVSGFTLASAAAIASLFW